MQVIGGFLTDRFGRKIVLGMEVLLWSFFYYRHPLGRIIWNARIDRRSRLYGTDKSSHLSICI